MERMRELICFPPRPVVSMDELMQREIYQLTAFFSQEAEPEVMRQMPHCTATRWYPTFADVVAKGVEKCVGLEVMGAYFGIRPEEMMAIDLVVFGELLHVHAQRLADFEQHGHGERALVLFDLVQVAGRDAQRVRQSCLRQAALGAQTAQLQAHEGFFHDPDDAPCGAAEIRNIRKRPGIFH